MAASFFFYDLETSGTNPRDARIMQFAGQRTDMELNPIGEPVNLLVKLTADIVPEPDAIILTGITPQSTLADGLTEAEFLQEFYDSVVQPDTVYLGFNTVRFDDEFMRYMHYRNFYDAYEWQWCDQCSRWDILDLVRMTRALRPEGIEWPFTPEGAPTNRLELIAKLNQLDHDQAHDALSDVHATIAVAKLIRARQPKLFDYLMEHRGKKKIIELLKTHQILTYSSGKYPKESLHTTAVTPLFEKPGEAHKGCYYVFDLRRDPTPFLAMTADELYTAWTAKYELGTPRFPVKMLKSNRCPAIIPGYPKDVPTQERLELSVETVTRHHQAIARHKQVFIDNLQQAAARMDDVRREKYGPAAVSDCDNQLYDSMLGGADKQAMRAVRAARPNQIMEYATKLHDERLQQILPRYKARNFPQALSADERQAWDGFVYHRLLDGGDDSRLGRYFKRLEELSRQSDLTENQRYLLEELQLYGESIMPSDASD